MLTSKVLILLTVESLVEHLNINISEKKLLKKPRVCVGQQFYPTCFGFHAKQLKCSYLKIIAYGNLWLLQIASAFTQMFPCWVIEMAIS